MWYRTYLITICPYWENSKLYKIHPTLHNNNLVCTFKKLPTGKNRWVLRNSDYFFTLHRSNWHSFVTADIKSHRSHLISYVESQINICKIHQSEAASQAIVFKRPCLNFYMFSSHNLSYCMCNKSDGCLLLFVNCSWRAVVSGQRCAGCRTRPHNSVICRITCRR